MEYFPYLKVRKISIQKFSTWKIYSMFLYGVILDYLDSTNSSMAITEGGRGSKREKPYRILRKGIYIWSVSVLLCLTLMHTFLLRLASSLVQYGHVKIL